MHELRENMTFIYTALNIYWINLKSIIPDKLQKGETGNNQSIINDKSMASAK